MVVLKLEMIPVNNSYWRKRYRIKRIVTKFQSDCIIYELKAYIQNKSGRAGTVKNGNISRTGGAANSNTVLF